MSLNVVGYSSLDEMIKQRGARKTIERIEKLIKDGALDAKDENVKEALRYLEYHKKTMQNACVELNESFRQLGKAFGIGGVECADKLRSIAEQMPPLPDTVEECKDIYGVKRSWWSRLCSWFRKGSKTKHDRKEAEKNLPNFRRNS